MTQKLYRSLLQVVFFLVCGIVQAADQPLPLWEVKGQGGTVYLFGSIHVCKASCYPISETALARFDASETLALELDPRNPDLATDVLQAAMLPAGQRLEDKLPAQMNRNLTEALRVVRVPALALSRFQPWFASTVIMMAAAGQHGMSSDDGVDNWLATRARMQGKPVVELETVARQLAAIAKGNDAEQISALQSVLEMVNSGRSGPYLDEMVAAWQSGDAVAIDRLIREADDGKTEWRADVLDARNEEMAARIAEWLEAGRNVFVVVGVAHLVGDNNIGDLLAKKSYAVRQMRDGE